GLAVKSRPPFILSAKFDAANVEPGKPIVATVTVNRAPSFTEEIVLNATGLRATVKATLKSIGKGQNEVKVTVDVAPTAVPGTVQIELAAAATAAVGDKADVIVEGVPTAAANYPRPSPVFTVSVAKK